MAYNSASSSSSSSSLLISSFHFHPTDEEIIINYLKPKTYGKLLSMDNDSVIHKDKFIKPVDLEFSIDRISVIHEDKFEPGDLTDHSSGMKNRNSEWYFFIPVDKVYGSGARTNRVTKQGYWKVTGKDGLVRQGEKTIGMKQTLVFYTGLAPHGEKTNWIMHEYRLVDGNKVEEKLYKTQLDAYVLCKVFRKKEEESSESSQMSYPDIKEQVSKVRDFIKDHNRQVIIITNCIILIIGLSILLSDIFTFMRVLMPLYVVLMMIIVAVFSSMSEFIFKVGDFFGNYNLQAVRSIDFYRSSVIRSFLLNIMLNWVTGLFVVIGIVLKLWVRDLLTSFIYLNITISLIIVPMTAYLLLQPKTKSGNPQLVLVWTIILLICNPDPNFEEYPALLIHCHHIANLIVFTVAAYLTFRKSLGPEQLPAQHYEMEASLANEGVVIYNDDDVLEQDNKFSNLVKKFGENFKRCFELLVYLFPKSYEFEKMDIIQLWVAEGYIQNSVETNAGLLEDAASVYFEAASIFQSSHSDGNNRPRYKLNHFILHDLHKLPSDEYCRIEIGKPVNLLETTLHASFICDGIDPVAFETLYQSKRLCTLMLLHEQRYSSINQLPYDLFLELPLLRALDLSGTNITELPSSVENLKHLRLLNLSKTLVKRLPESLCSLDQMQTMILRDCSELVGLPKGMRKLVKLRHLDVDIASLLISMPPGLGDLIELQTLSAFIVGKDDGSHIKELKRMANLRGSLGIMMLENISNSEEAKEADLDKKKYLERLELQWTESQAGADVVLEHLQPHENLKELQIVGYCGAQFPAWIGNPYFSKLVTITLHNCSKCEVLPSLGRLPLLGRLQISEMHAVKTIDARFCGRDMATPLLDLVLQTVRRQTNPCNGFLRLNNLRISGMPTLEKWHGMEEGDFSLLRKLSLSRFAKLTALPELSVLKALQELEISLCPVLQFLPKKSLPTSLQSLLIISCPLLKEQCQKDGQEWGKIAHIPSIWFDNQQFL